MICCLNPHCQHPQNSDGATVCQSCGRPISLLRGRYRAIQLLGQGGFGRTYLASDEDRLSARCVIKQFSPQVQGTKSLEKAVRLFNQEAVRLHELGENPQIPTLLAYFEQEQYLYLVQQFVEGQSLLQQMREQGPFNERQIRDVLSDILPVLRFVHRHQVIHRDITPTNILRRLTDDRLILIDFGVAKQISEETAAEPGTRIGTEGYAPMEQFRGGKAYPASDLYSLGATCLHLMTQTRPDNLYDPLNGCWFWREYLQQEKNILVSDQLAHILNYLLKDLVSERYQSADEVMRDLNADSFLPPDAAASNHRSQSPFAPPTAPPRVMPPPIAQPNASRPLPSRPPTSRPPSSRPPISQSPAAPPPSSTSRPPVSGGPTGSPISGSPDAHLPSFTPPAGSATPAPMRSLSLGTRSVNARLSRCIHTLTGHNSWVTCVAVSASSPTIASSSLDDTIKVWNLNTGEELLTLRGHSRGVNSIAISPDGKTLVSGSDDYTIKVWSLHTGALLGTLNGHTRDVNAVAISPDGRILLSGGEDRTMRLWQMATGALLRTQSGLAGMIKAVAISPDGRLLASGGLDNKTKLWNMQTGEQLQTFVGHLHPVNTVVFSPTGQAIATGSKDKSIRLWNAKTGELVRTLIDHTRDVNSIAMSPNGKTLISGSSDTTIKLWDLFSGKVTATWHEHTDTVNSIALTPDGRFAISGSSDKTVRIWQLTA